MISVCMIVRDAAGDLDESLGSVREIADEIIVTDTGSTDGSVAIARRHGAVTDHFPWCDDFSAARNHALARATGEWVLWLDSDEALEMASVPALRRAVERPDVDGFQVIRHDLMDAGDPARHTRMLQLRLFRREGAAFVGRCHPDFDPPLARVETAKGIVIRHWGYVAERMPEKLRRSARLLALELEERPGRLYYRIELLRTYLQLGDARAGEVLAQAGDELAAHRKDASAPLPHAALLLETLLQWPADNLPAGWTTDELEALAARWFPDAPPLLWLAAGRAFLAGRYGRAEAKLRRLLAMGRSHDYDRHTSFDPGIVGEEAALNLAACLIKQAKLAEAKRLLRPLAESGRVGDRARANLAAIDRLKGG